MHPLPHLQTIVITDRQVYRPGEPVFIKVLVYNYDLGDITVSFGGCLATFTVADRNGKLWYEYRPVCTAEIKNITVPAGQTVELGRFRWDQVDNDGHQVPVPNAYVITGYVLSYEYVPPATTEIAIVSAYEPILGGAAFNMSFVVALSQRHFNLGAASTIDAVAAIPLAGAMADGGMQGLPPALLDVEATAYDGVNITMVQRGNLLAFGGRGVNAVTRYYNDLRGSQALPVRFVPQNGLCTTDALGNPLSCYRRVVDTTGGVVDYAAVTITYDAAASRFVMVAAGLSGYATRAMGELIPLRPREVLTGTGTIVRLEDREGDGSYETFQAVDGTGGFQPMSSPETFPRPQGVAETFAVGLSQAHGVVGAANTIDVVGAIPMAVREARLRQGPVWAALDTEVASLDGTAILSNAGDLLALGGRGNNLVTSYYNPAMPIRTGLNFQGICTVDSAGNPFHCYKGYCDLTGGYCVYYSYWAETMEAVGRHAKVVVGTSGFLTRAVAVYIAQSEATDVGTGAVVAFKDINQDGIPDSEGTVVERTGIA